MKRKPKPAAPPVPLPALPRAVPHAQPRAPNPRLQPDARWQRFQHYTWDRKKG
jgi:hypothetical protein